jgi:hypothetical protein
VQSISGRGRCCAGQRVQKLHVCCGPEEYL